MGVPRSTGIFPIAAVGYVVVGLLLIGGLSPSWRAFSATLADANGRASVAFHFLFVIAPAGGPGAATGAIIAAWMLERRLERRPASRSLAFWLARALGIGAILGAANVALWFAVLNGAMDLGPMSLVGAGAGAAVALPVGIFCWGISRRPISSC
jgi:hypothetical protein